MDKFDTACTANTDTELIRAMQSGNESALESLIKKYSRIVRICARPFTLIGWDYEDFIQEGMFGLIRALNRYDFSSGASLPQFIEICVRRQLYNAVRKAQNGKNASLGNYVSLDMPVTVDDNPVLLEDVLSDNSPSVEELLIQKDHAQRLLSALSAVLSPLEKSVLSYYLDGLSIQEIAFSLGLSPKSAGNAITRIKNKASRLLPNFSDNRQ